MNIAIIGTGYVGLVTGACLAASGNQVTCIDRDMARLARLTAGRLPFHEPGLGELINDGLHQGLLMFCPDLQDGTRKADIVFLAIDTPATDDGYTHPAGLLKYCHELVHVLRRDTIIAVKSAVPVGTCERLQAIFDHNTKIGPPVLSIIVAANPEFLAEGCAVEDFLHPERIVIGSDNKRAILLLRRLYTPFDPTGERFIIMDIRSAEFAKYACKAMLATRMSMIKELSCLSSQLNTSIRSMYKEMVVGLSEAKLHNYH